MRRVVSVWFPTLPTDRFRWLEQGQDSALDPRRGPAPFDPVLPHVTIANRRLAAVDATAAGLGLRVGMKLAQAQALVPGVQVHNADPVGDQAALVRLAEWCLRYAPLAAADPPDGLWIDVTGSTHLHGGETRLLRDLLSRLNSQGLTARAAVADTPGVAHAAVRYGEGGVMPPDAGIVVPPGAGIMVPPGTGIMANFPIQALRLPPGTVTDLRLMGFERVGSLLAAPRAPLGRRFGTRLALRLDQATGRVFEPIQPVVPAALIQARLAFVEPLLIADAFSAVITRLVALVRTGLEQAGQGARRLDLLFERVDGSVQAIRVGTAKPSRDASHLGRMLKERLERVDPGPGVEAMHLIVSAADPWRFEQASTSLIETPTPDIAPLVDRLVNRLGEASVYRIAPVESDVPERSVRRVPAMTRISGGWPADLPRPVRLLNPPQPVEAMALLPDAPPIAFTWRRIRHRVRHADGPERIAGEWWKRDREMQTVRDYFRVEDENGRRYWLFRRGNGSDAETGDMRWFLHGFF